jgi:MFS transporter, AAHS family, 4-hydroxybenzoate transporter
LQGTFDIEELLENQARSRFSTTVFLLCCLVMLADGFDNQTINYAAPAIIAEWTINRALMTPVFNLSVAGAIIGAVVFSSLADRYGRRPATIAAVAVFGAFTLAIPLARDLTSLALLRLGASFGVGGGMPMAITLACDYAKRDRRAWCATLLFLGYTAGSSGGGWLAAFIVPAFGWRAVFYLGGCAGVAIAAALLAGLPESLKFLALRRPRDPRLSGYVQRLLPGIDVSRDAAFTITAAAASGPPLRELFADRRSAMTLSLWFALGFAFATHFFLSQWLTTLLSPVIGFADAARTQALFQAGAGFSFVFGYLIDRRGIPVTAFTMFAAALPVAAIGWTAQSDTALAMGLALISGILVLGGDIGISTLPCIIYPPAIRSSATGAAFGVGRVGAILGPLLAGLLIWLNVPLSTIFIISALPVLCSGAACVVLDRVVSGQKRKAAVAEMQQSAENVSRGAAETPRLGVSA